MKKMGFNESVTNEILNAKVNTDQVIDSLIIIIMLYIYIVWYGIRIV